MKIILTVVTLFVAHFVLAQKPRYVPFQYQGETSIMDVDGNMVVGPRTFNDNHIVGDFKAYIVRDQRLTDQDFFFNAVSGKGLDKVAGTMDRACGALAVGDRTFYHFWVDGESVMVSYESDPVFLPKRYLKIEPNQRAWDNENLSKKHFVWALNEDYTYDVLLPEHRFKAVENLPDFTSYDLVFGSSATGGINLIGFLLGSWEAIDRKYGQMYGIPPSDSLVTVYNVDFEKLGTSAYRDKDISALFKKEVQLRGGMIPPPQIMHQLINPAGATVVLNDEFSLIPDTANNERLVLVNTQKNNELVLGVGNFDYRYFSTSGNTKALLQIRHSESGSIFFFDFDGTFFPKGIPMIPKDKMQWILNQ